MLNAAGEVISAEQYIEKAEAWLYKAGGIEDSVQQKYKKNADLYVARAQVYATLALAVATEDRNVMEVEKNRTEAARKLEALGYTKHTR